MKRTAALFLLIGSLALGSLGALDFGGTIYDSTGYFTNASPNFDQANRLSLWFNTYLGKHLFFYAQASGYYQNQTTYGGSSFGLYADLDRFSLHGEFNNVGSNLKLFTFDLGRFVLSDPTGEIYNQVLDGTRLYFAYPLMSVSATAGYTGLIIKPDSTIIMSQADLTGITQSTQYFGSPRAIGSLTLDAPSLFLQQDVNFNALVQEDLRPLFANNGLVSAGTTTYSPSQGGALDSQYFTLGISGPIVSTLFWDGSFTLETGRMLSYLTASSVYQYTSILAYLARGGVHYYMPEIMSLSVGLDVNYASGDGDFSKFYGGNTGGDATAFIPVTQANLATVFAPQLSNIISGAFSVSLKPLSFSPDPNLSNLQTAIAVVPFLRPTPGPVSVGGVLNKVNDGNTQIYLGTEIDATVNYRPLSDVGAALTGGVFLPNAAAFAAGAQGVQYGAKVELSTSF